MSNWKDLIKNERDGGISEEEAERRIEAPWLYEDENSDEQESREKLMNIYRNLHSELKKAANELEKYGHKLKQNDGYVRLMISIEENWEYLRDSGEFGFGGRGTDIDG